MNCLQTQKIKLVFGPAQDCPSTRQRGLQEDSLGGLADRAPPGKIMIRSVSELCKDEDMFWINRELACSMRVVWRTPGRPTYQHWHDANSWGNVKIPPTTIYLKVAARWIYAPISRKPRWSHYLFGEGRGRVYCLQSGRLHQVGWCCWRGASIIGKWNQPGCNRTEWRRISVLRKHTSQNHLCAGDTPTNSD